MVVAVDTDGVAIARSPGAAGVEYHLMDGRSEITVVVPDRGNEPPPAPPGFEGDRVVFPNDTVAFIIGPQLRAGSPLNPHPWYDETALERGLVHAARALDPGTPKSEMNGYVMYYDLGLTLYTAYYRTGDAQYLDHARKVVDRWYDGYLLPDGITGYAPRSVNLAGIILRATDGRPELWDYTVAYVRMQYDNWLGRRLDNPKLYYGIRDGGYALLYAAQLAKVHPDAAVRAEMRQKALAAATQYYARLQRADGGWYYKAEGHDDITQPFQVGLLMEGLIATHQITGDPVVAQTITRGVDWLWNVGFDSDDPWRCMWYLVHSDWQTAGDAAFSGHKEGSVPWNCRQLNPTNQHAFGYAYQLTGDGKYLDWGDFVLAATFDRDPARPRETSGLADFRGKEYNQSYRSSGRYLIWRLER